ncbi:MAG: methylenetetrahydrofolate reductase C-terminal domain-containing protein, partial [Desulfobacteraceae bacterium]
IKDALFTRVLEEWRNKRAGLKKSIERAAILGAVLKGLGFRGIHIGGVHRSFQTVGAILDRMEKIQDSWQDHLEEICFETRSGYYQFGKQAEAKINHSFAAVLKNRFQERYPYAILKKAHQCFFVKTNAFSPVYKKMAQAMDTAGKAWLVKRILEDPFKKLTLSCQGCGDCAIQHLSFLCPESGCPKHTRNGPCGGSRDEKCEVNPEKTCVWVRAYGRAAVGGSAHELARAFVPPRMWELNNTSSWINFHLERDHHASPTAVTHGKPSRNQRDIKGDFDH